MDQPRNQHLGPKLQEEVYLRLHQEEVFLEDNSLNSSKLHLELEAEEASFHKSLKHREEYLDSKHKFPVLIQEVRGEANPKLLKG